MKLDKLLLPGAVRFAVLPPDCFVLPNSRGAYLLSFLPAGVLFGGGCDAIRPSTLGL